MKEIKAIFQERVPRHIGEQTEYVPVPHIMKEKLEGDLGHFLGARSRAHRGAERPLKKSRTLHSSAFPSASSSTF